MLAAVQSPQESSPVSAGPFEEYFRHVLQEAHSRGASDIHVEPHDGHLLVKFRIDSLLSVHDRLTEPKYIQRLREVMKRQCGFDMGVRDVPQDGRFAPAGMDFDCRASLCPTMWGEKLVLRLLEKSKAFDLQRYGLPEPAMQHLASALSKWQGLVIISGPTGCGKTTLLYSALASIDRVENNVHSIEDPIEYRLENLNQTQVVHGSVSFGQVLRTLMRQDPDVILVGEVRDEETAEAAVHAASTGHLLLTTVHANSAAEIVRRMEGLGVSKEVFSANLLFASAQRLVPRLCPRCAIDDPRSRERVRATLGVDIAPKLARGCDGCTNGVRGRVLLFEWLTRQKLPGEQHYSVQQHENLKTQAIHYLRLGAIDANAACGVVG
jgi:type II secretory ATPase GspE/PulE/Tfp pilus assembly ATPase PilB-like protein